jgi:hypothetical protein
MKRLLGLAALLLVVGAGPCAAKAPAAFGAQLDAAADTIRVTANACVVSGAPTVGCAVVLTGTVGAAPIVFPAQANLLPGQTLNVVVPITCTDRAPISVSVSSRGFNSNTPPDFSLATVGTGTAVCPAAPPGVPGAITVQIQVISP